MIRFARSINQRCSRSIYSVDDRSIRASVLSQFHERRKFKSSSPATLRVLITRILTFNRVPITNYYITATIIERAICPYRDPYQIYLTATAIAANYCIKRSSICRAKRHEKMQMSDLTCSGNTKNSCKTVSIGEKKRHIHKTTLVSRSARHSERYTFTWS